MTNEFTAWCNYYYQLSTLFADVEEYFQNLLNDAPLYSGQTRLSEVDALIDYYRAVQAEKTKMEQMAEEVKQAERTILAMMRHFEIQPGTVLTGEIPGEMAYEVWADEQDSIHIRKTRELAAEEDDPNIIVIKLSGF
ncbi:hypothetical protein [uncultured Mucilaginibacter sp.]|uniref:hypothetical protein n=1 Tax=uncultured Mucilaginibacter sp. TaxID=797541 RepID=UPI0025FE61C7|nr:hypothetical protein [uncultured Mucilaginibacter sp.]